MNGTRRCRMMVVRMMMHMLLFLFLFRQVQQFVGNIIIMGLFQSLRFVIIFVMSSVLVTVVMMLQFVLSIIVGQSWLVGCGFIFQRLFALRCHRKEGCVKGNAHPLSELSNTSQ